MFSRQAASNKELNDNWFFVKPSEFWTALYQFFSVSAQSNSVSGAIFVTFLCYFVL